MIYSTHFSKSRHRWDDECFCCFFPFPLENCFIWPVGGRFHLSCPGQSCSSNAFRWMSPNEANTKLRYCFICNLYWVIVTLRIAQNKKYKSTVPPLFCFLICLRRRILFWSQFHFLLLVPFPTLLSGFTLIPPNIINPIRNSNLHWANFGHG